MPVIRRRATSALRATFIMFLKYRYFQKLSLRLLRKGDF